MSQKTKSQETNEVETNEVDTIKLGETVYSVNSITERGNQLIADIQRVEGLIQQQQLTLSVSALAKGKLIDELEEEAQNFEAIEISDVVESVNDDSE